MHEAMAKLAALLGHHRRAVALAWLAVVLAALPFTQDQTSELTGGGIDVPGSQSKAASGAIERHFPSSSDGLGAVLQASPGANRADRAASLWLPHGAVDGARAQFERGDLALLQSDESPDQITDVAVDLTLRARYRGGGQRDHRVHGRPGRRLGGAPGPEQG
jgi:hypothetical protein